MSDDSSNVGLLRDRTKIRDIRDLEDGNAVDQVLLVRDSELRQTRSGANFMSLALADRTGVITGLVWDEVENRGRSAGAVRTLREPEDRRDPSVPLAVLDAADLRRVDSATGTNFLLRQASPSPGLGNVPGEDGDGLVHTNNRLVGSPNFP